MSRRDKAIRIHAWTPLILLVAGLALVAGGEALVRGAVRLSADYGISALVIGLTVVAAGGVGADAPNAPRPTSP